MQGDRQMHKPFVEKPSCGDNHNVWIYYPHSMGGGVKMMFRKVGNKSADYDPSHPGTVRRDGSYIYEEFVATSGTDIKVYTVGSEYAHAEARKSPVVDGKVQRTADGKEVRPAAPSAARCIHRGSLGAVVWAEHTMWRPLQCSCDVLEDAQLVPGRVLPHVLCICFMAALTSAIEVIGISG